MPEVSDEALIPVDIIDSTPEFELPDNLVSLKANVLNWFIGATDNFSGETFVVPVLVVRKISFAFTVSFNSSGDLNISFVSKSSDTFPLACPCRSSDTLNLSVSFETSDAFGRIKLWDSEADLSFSEICNPSETFDFASAANSSMSLILALVWEPSRALRF